jgi:hypothetical protein
MEIRRRPNFFDSFPSILKIAGTISELNPSRPTVADRPCPLGHVLGCGFQRDHNSMRFLKKHPATTQRFRVGLDFLKRNVTVELGSVDGQSG